MPPKKPKLGQNFLVDDRARHAIADALGDVSARTVVEIGPGRGAITGILAERARRLVLIEFDRALAAELRFRFRNQAHVEIIEGDILQTDIGAFASAGDTLDVIGNLPYYITSDILLHLFAAARGGCLGRAVVMMQREVAERVTAQPGVRDYGLLSVTTQLAAEAESLFTLPPDAFSPPPDVYSSVVRLHFNDRAAALGVEPVPFERFLRQAFAQKRKTLANALRAAGHEQQALAAAWPAGVDPLARAESLPVETLAALYRALNTTESPLP